MGLFLLHVHANSIISPLFFTVWGCVCPCLPSCDLGAGRHRVCHFVLISYWAIQPETAPHRPCLTLHLGCNYKPIRHAHTHKHTLPNLSKFILCSTDTRTSVGVCFQRRCDLNCLSLKLSLIVLAVLLYGNGRGVAEFMLSYSYSRKQGSERPCSHLQLSPHTHKHTLDWKRHRHVIYLCWCYRFVY